MEIFDVVTRRLRSIMVGTSGWSQICHLLLATTAIGALLGACNGEAPTESDSTMATQISNSVESTTIAMAVESTLEEIRARSSPTVTVPPTATPTADDTPTPIPTATEVPTSTPVPTATSEPTPTEQIETQVVEGCGGDTVSYFLWELDVKRNLDQWNRLVDSENLVIEAWNHWVASTEEILSFEQAAGNSGLVEVSNNFLMTAQRERSEIEAESYFGEFSGLASASVALIDAQVTMISLFREAAINHDPDAWNQAIDAGSSVDTRFDDYDRALEDACGYWNSR